MNSGKVALAQDHQFVSHGTPFAMQAGRQARLATTDHTNVASNPSSNEVALPGCRTPLHPPQAPGWF